jgi:Raf kinase inhibitor-like YbhB/YbcL family protein
MSIMVSKRNIVLFCFLALAMAFLVVSCSRGEKSKAPQEKGTSAVIELTSPAFVTGASMPAKYTCDGESVSPPLQWSGVPQDAQSLALIGEDPDAPEGSRVLWLVYNIPPSVTQLSEALPAVGILPNGAKQGMNDSKNLGYTGPCPPSGKTHRVMFKIYALDDMPKLPPGISKKDLINAMERHHLGERQLMATCQKK